MHAYETVVPKADVKLRASEDCKKSSMERRIVGSHNNPVSDNFAVRQFLMIILFLLFIYIYYLKIK